VIAETAPLPDALITIEQAKGMLQEIKALLPPSSNANFRERFVAHCEKSADAEFRRKADALLAFYENVFGVKDLLD